MNSPGTLSDTVIHCFSTFIYVLRNLFRHYYNISDFFTLRIQSPPPGGDIAPVDDIGITGKQRKPSGIYGLHGHIIKDFKCWEKIGHGRLTKCYMYLELEVYKCLECIDLEIKR